MTDTSPTISPTILTQLVHRTYASLPKSLKPTVRSNGIPEWTILSGIVLTSPTLPPRVISIGTGVKCLPTNRLPPCGDTLHDSHAEILAKRGFRRFLVDEALNLNKGGQSEIIERVETTKFRIKKDVGIHLYVSALPCGNASTLYTAAHQPKSMAALKDSHAPIPSLNLDKGISRGRNGYTDTSSLRTKPGRPDSFPSISMSCSDKIASWNILGLQGGLLGRYFNPVYLDSVIIGGVGEEPSGEDVVGWNGEVGWEDGIKAEVKEALYGRLERLDGKLPKPYRLARPSIHFTHFPFSFDKPTISTLHPNADPTPHSTSIVHYLSTSTYITEHHFNGVDRRAIWKAPGLKPIEEKRRSGICKLEMMRAVSRLEDGIGIEKGREAYFDKKQGTVYQDVKALLRGKLGQPKLIMGFEKCGELSSTENCTEEDPPPFVGWIVSGKRWESFDHEGNIVESVSSVSNQS